MPTHTHTQSQRHVYEVPEPGFFFFFWSLKPGLTCLPKISPVSVLFFVFLLL